MIASKIQKYFNYLLTGIFSTILLVNVTILLFANQLVFIPNNSYRIYPDIPQYEQFLESDKYNNKIDIRFYNNDSSEDLIIFFHGNGGFNTNYLKDLYNHGNIIFASYPGYLDSTGNPKIKYLESTAEIVLKKSLDLGFSANKITIFGHSLGGYPASYLAKNNEKFKSIKLVNTFDTGYSMCKEKLFSIFCLTTNNKLNTKNKLVNSNQKIEIYHARNDNVIPFRLGKKLFESIESNSITFIEISGDHNKINFSEVFNN